MKINIPKKLEQYKSFIKKKSIHVMYAREIALLRLGGNQSEEQVKEIYLCYNPYNTSIKLDINHFKTKDNIFKMYPPIINIPSKEAFVFLIYSNEKSKLEIDEEYLLFHKKQKINTLINDLTKRNFNKKMDILVEEYDPSIHSTVLLDENLIMQNNDLINKLSIDKTQYLKDFNHQKDIQYTIPKANDSELEVKLDSVKFLKDSKKYKIILEFINSSKEDNYQINGFNLTIFDNSNDLQYQIDQIFRIKGKTKKKVSFHLEEENLNKLNLNELKIKVKF